MNIPELATPYAPIKSLLYLSHLPKILNTAIDLKIFETLHQEDLTLEDISKKLSTDPVVTRALLNVLAAVGLLTVKEDQYGLTALSSQYLVENSDANQLLDIKSYAESTDTFDSLEAVLKGEKAAFNPSMWSLKEVALAMEQGVKAGPVQNLVAFVKNLPEFASCTKMCDFAGSIGYFSFALLEQNRNLEAHVLELPAVCQAARELKKEEKDFDRISYHDFDLSKDHSLGSGYDLFLSANFLYEMGAYNALADFLILVNQSMKLGGLFVSNHICDQAPKESKAPLALLELNTVYMGYPTHQLPEAILKSALEKAGFGEFSTRPPDESTALPILLLSAKKISEVN